MRPAAADEPPCSSRRSGCSATAALRVNAGGRWHASLLAACRKAAAATAIASLLRENDRRQRDFSASGSPIDSLLVSGLTYHRRAVYVCCLYPARVGIHGRVQQVRRASNNYIREEAV